MWKTLSEVRIADILQFVRDASRDGQAVHVGTDPVSTSRSWSAWWSGQGFKALIKPESWAASHAADHVVRSHGKLPRNGVVVGWPSGEALVRKTS